MRTYCFKKTTLFFLSILLISILLIINPPSSDAAQKEYLKSGTTSDIPTIGLKIKIFKDMEANPPGSVKNDTLIQRRGNETKKVTVYSPLGLWKRDQLAGRWINKAATLSIYSISMMPPDKIPSIYQGFVLKEAYDKWKESQEAEKSEWNDKNLKRWIETMTGDKLSPSPVIPKKGVPRQSVTKLFSSASGSGDLYYVITGSYSKDRPILIHITFNPVADRKKSLRTVESILSSAKLYKPKTTQHTSKQHIFTTSRSLTKNKVKHSPEYIASRDAVIKSIQNLKDWWYIETENFVMVANIKNKKTARDLSINLEKSRNVYTKFYPVKIPLKAVSVARMFEKRDQYVSYVGEELKWSGGVWMPSIKELAISPMDWGSRSDRRKMMIETTFHNAFYQYLFFATGERKNAVWFNEGNAQFFEDIRFRGSKFTIGMNEKRAAQVKNLTSLKKIQAMLKMSHEKFYAEPGRNDNYTLSWGIIYFLQKGAPIMRKKNNYHKIPMKYYDTIRKTGDWRKATETAWEDVDIEQFASDFDKFWNSKSLIKKAVRYDPLKK